MGVLYGMTPGPPVYFRWLSPRMNLNIVLNPGTNSCEDFFNDKIHFMFYTFKLGFGRLIDQACPPFSFHLILSGFTDLFCEWEMGTAILRFMTCIHYAINLNILMHHNINMY